MTNDIAPPPKGNNDIRRMMAIIMVGKTIDDRFGPLALEYLGRIAIHEATGECAGREQIALESLPTPRTTSYRVPIALEDQGLIERFQDDVHAQRRPLRTTRKGRALLDKARAFIN